MHPPTVRLLQLYTPQGIRAELERVGADSSLAERRARAEFYLVKVEYVSLPLARLLYQELVMEGGQVVMPPRLEHTDAGETAALLCATRYQFNHLLVRLRWQHSEELQSLADEIERALDAFSRVPPPFRLGESVLEWNGTRVMGILNVTPDSFSGDGLIRPGDDEGEIVARALSRAWQLAADGADVLDVGGESTHPRAAPVNVETELQRVLPVIRALKQEMNIPISIDTSKARVADAALAAGAAMVNDVMGLCGDPEMARVVAAYDTAVVIMHNGKPDENARDFLSAMLDALRAQFELAHNAGINASHILIDPGLGFGKTPAQNLEILNRLGEFRVLGCPILIGPSRKGFISKTLDVAMDQREEGTAAAVAVGIARGANMVRVHDVRAMARVAKMTDAVIKLREFGIRGTRFA